MLHENDFQEHPSATNFLPSGGDKNESGSIKRKNEIFPMVIYDYRSENEKRVQKTMLSQARIKRTPPKGVAFCISLFCQRAYPYNPPLKISIPARKSPPMNTKTTWKSQKRYAGLECTLAYQSIKQANNRSIDQSINQSIKPSNEYLNTATHDCTAA